MQGYNRGVVGDTLITMWDLSQKPISQLKVEDEILAYDETNEERINETWCSTYPLIDHFKLLQFFLHNYFSIVIDLKA